MMRIIVKNILNRYQDEPIIFFFFNRQMIDIYIYVEKPQPQQIWSCAVWNFWKFWAHVITIIFNSDSYYSSSVIINNYALSLPVLSILKTHCHCFWYDTEDSQWTFFCILFFSLKLPGCWQISPRGIPFRLE